MWGGQRPELQEHPSVKQQVIIQKTPGSIMVKVQSW
jgi:hypothetical protein